MLKFFLLLFTLMIIAGGLTGCALKEQVVFNFYDFAISEDELEKEVTGWNVYINPVWRYRVRIPMDWTIQKSDESAKVVDFFYNNKKQLTIKGVENFETEYDLETYMLSQDKQVFLSGYYESLSVNIGGKKGTLVKKTFTEEGDKADLLIIVFKDRIFDIQIWNSNEDARTVLNSLEFYEGGGYSLE